MQLQHSLEKWKPLADSKLSQWLCLSDFSEWPSTALKLADANSTSQDLHNSHSWNFFLSPIPLKYALLGKIVLHGSWESVHIISECAKIQGQHIASIWAHHLSLWDLEAGEQDDSLLCLRFKVSCFHPLSHHLWSGGTYGVVKSLLLRSLRDWSSSLTCTFIKIKANCPSPQIYKDPRTFHHSLGTYMLQLKRATLQGNQRNWGRLPWLQF